MEHVVLVDDKDEVLGTMEKLEAHQKGLLHRAFSVMVFNSFGELMLQKRASSKYHSGGLWTNTCCSHPRMGETTEEAAKRRLFEEMGIDLSPIFKYKFIYRAELDQNLIEHEYDHVFTAVFDGSPELNEEEAEDWRFVPISKLRQDIAENPSNYTEWFKIIMEQYR
ncbi:MAG: isopentenyl-diphosphate Delta-isomerase [Bacteroidota bacterium]